MNNDIFYFALLALLSFLVGYENLIIILILNVKLVTEIFCILKNILNRIKTIDVI